MLLRGILAIPLSFVVFFVAIATFFVVLVGWFAALFTGRVPDFARNLATVYLRMGLRLQAYVMLLTDRFPPFDTEDVADYPVHVAVPYATRMNRAAVFFRIIVVIPAYLLSSLLGSGYVLLAFFTWVVTLCTGWLPAPVHDAYRAILRYQTRLNAYMLLLLPTYPGQLFGDGGPGITAEGRAVGVQGDVGDTTAVPPASIWSLFLGKGAKRVLVLVIILGVPSYFGSVVLRVFVQNHSGLVQQNNDLANGLNQFVISSSDCRTAAAPVTCQEGADRVLSHVLQNFVANVQGATAFGVNQSVLVQVISDADNAATVTTALADAGPTAVDYQNVYVRTNADKVLTQLVSGQMQLKNALNATRFG